MRIGVLGGTGEMGRGLSIRLVLKHELLIGSRSLGKAENTARSLSRIARGFYQSDMQGSMRGVLNEDAVKEAEMLIISLPPRVSAPYLKSLGNVYKEDQAIISTVVPMRRRKKLFYWAPLEGEEFEEFRLRSAAEIIQEVVEPANVVSAFQTVPAAYLSNIDTILNIDVLMAGNDELALNKVGSIVRDIPNLRPLRVGPLENSKFIESITPLLLNVGVLNGLHEPSIRVVPWIPPPEQLG